MGKYLNIDGVEQLWSNMKSLWTTDLSTKADLVDGKVPASQLPSYVDDVLEYEGSVNFPNTGETGKIYMDTNTEKIYRWSGSAYVEISPNVDYVLPTASTSTLGGDDWRQYKCG